MPSILLIADGAAPLEEGQPAVSASGLARALAAAGHPTTLLTLGGFNAVRQLPGLARRLRKARVTLGDKEVEVGLLEGRAAPSDVHLLVVEAEPEHRGAAAAVLASATEWLTRDGLLKPDLTIAWGETAAAALSATAASVRLFALPDGRPGRLLAEPEAAVLGVVSYGDELGGRSLSALGAASANAIIAPSPAAAAALISDPALAGRASDEPILTLRFGCDDPPNDPAIDSTLPATFSATATAGKAECRRALARRTSLAVGPRTLVLALAPLQRDRGAEAVLAMLPKLAAQDVVVVVPGEPGDKDAVDRARVIAIEQPGRIAILVGGDPAAERQLRAGADALLLADPHELVGRPAGLALMSGTLPLAPQAGAYQDYLVDFDPRSRTGTGLLYRASDPFEMEGAVRRAITLRRDVDLWSPLVTGLMQAAPRWSAAAATMAAIADGSALSGQAR